MGIVSLSLSQSNDMKFLLVLAVAAYVKAEADPAFVYSTAGVITHVLPYAHVAYPYVHAAPLAAGCTNNDGALVPCAHGLVAPVVAAAAAPAAAEAEAVETVAKREADPWLYYSGLYGHGYGYHGYAPFAYSYAPYTYSHVYSHYGLPYAYYGKRSADAEPEADAEADPALLYSHYGYPYSYGYGYRYGGLPYAHYPYAYYGKRSADAEPEAKADADPYLLYGGYYRPYAYHAGYYPYSYGYPYAYGLWGKK